MLNRTNPHMPTARRLDSYSARQQDSYSVKFAVSTFIAKPELGLNEIDPEIKWPAHADTFCNQRRFFVRACVGSVFCVLTSAAAAPVFETCALGWLPRSPSLLMSYILVVAGKCSRKFDHSNRRGT